MDFSGSRGCVRIHKNVPWGTQLPDPRSVPCGTSVENFQGDWAKVLKQIPNITINSTSDDKDTTNKLFAALGFDVHSTITILVRRLPLGC